MSASRSLPIADATSRRKRPPSLLHNHHRGRVPPNRAQLEKTREGALARKAREKKRPESSEHDHAERVVTARETPAPRREKTQLRPFSGADLRWRWW
jgi:hypothetical protein